MRNLAMISLVAMAAGSIASPAFAQSNQDSVSTTGSATIAAPITLTEDTPLRFGTVIRPRSGTNIVRLPTDTCAPALEGGGDAALIAGTTGCATYTVTGEDGMAFSISTDATFDMSNGTDTIEVTLTKSADSGTIGTSDTFKVGGSFEVGTTTESGAYTGQFSVTVAYQ